MYINNQEIKRNKIFKSKLRNKDEEKNGFAEII